MTEAFGLAEPIGPADLIRRRGQVEAWRLGTGAGEVLIKRFWADDELPWQDELELAMQVEQQAVDAGIATPAPIRPVHPVFGSVAKISRFGLFRAFPYLEHRPLADDDDVAEWVGTTLARTHDLHRLDDRPAPNWWYGQFPPVRPRQWSCWLQDGETAGAAWAPSLRRHLDLVVEQTGRVVRTFHAAPPYALSHRDFEPWNVLMAGDRPMLIDWDTAGPESIPLEAAYVLTTFARRGRDSPDQQLLQRSYRAYLVAGGPPLTAGPGSLDRMIGTHLAKIADAVRRFFDTQDDGHGIGDRIDRFPATVANARAWEQLLGTVCAD
ncbi:phosphotransferase enzyme family protein [Microlunatus soli]|uniref:Phosphotransferase enzyme family protein n=1 Tax=Microlunatus soli TaxID=630515 RepID=A0A1H1SSY1_9ACTN|nr:phosphotransferase [Microlunatus soli]SDS51084.1 Phosphotransferase enzyme family protein [Microlunatus soli]